MTKDDSSTCVAIEVENRKRYATDSLYRPVAHVRSSAHRLRIQTIFDESTMTKLALFALLAGSAAAFAPASQSSSSRSSALLAVQDEIGVLPPTGFFDPLKLATPENFADYRARELKHGRVAMLAVIGYIVPEVYRFSGDIAPGLPFADVPNGVAALNAIPSLGWAQMFFLVGAVDYYGFLGNFEFVSACVFLEDWPFERFSTKLTS